MPVKIILGFMVQPQNRQVSGSTGQRARRLPPAQSLPTYCEEQLRPPVHKSQVQVTRRAQRIRALPRSSPWEPESLSPRSYELKSTLEAQKTSSSAGKMISSSAGKISSSAGKISSSAGKTSSSAGKISSSAGKTSSSAGKISSSAGKISSSAGKISSSAGKISSSAGKQNVLQGLFMG
ncbi:hypothetical protein STEG23_022319 [Scotinomys teguina]